MDHRLYAIMIGVAVVLGVFFHKGTLETLPVRVSVRKNDIDELQKFLEDSLKDEPEI